MTTLGRYQIFDQLGTGSMGTVYRAQDTVLEREVALKTIRTEGNIHPELRERFYREARACARLQHPSIVVVHDLGEVDQVAYIAMELLDGSDFRKLIEQRAEIPLATKLEVMAQVCDALAYAHRRGIIHRDIKPSNLFLIEKRHAKVLDFGIARLPSSSLTQQGKVLGTPNYMAPEQIQGKPPDGRSDLFSAAVVFFEFLVYAHPFQGENIPRRIVEDAPDTLRAAERKLPVLLERIFTRGLAKEPVRRYRTGDEFAADLRAVSDLLLQNASPSFSRAPLPSERDVRALPSTEDAYESRLSELMQLIPEFEDAIAQGDTTAAQQILVRLEAIGAADSRCAEPVRLCRARLAELAPSTAATPVGSPDSASEAASTAPPQVSDSGTGSGMKTCVYCEALNRSAAVYCIQCGAKLTAAVPAPLPEPVASVPEPVTAPVEAGTRQAGLDATSLFQPTGATTVLTRETQANAPEAAAAANPTEISTEPPEPAAVGPASAPATPRPQRGPYTQVFVRDWIARKWALFPDLVRKQKQVALLAAAFLVAIAIMIVIALSFPPVKEMPWTVRAEVKPTLASVYTGPNTRSKMMTLPREEYVHVSRPPRDGEEWIQMQVVRKEKIMRPGYMRLADLDKWFSHNPSEELRLLMEQDIPANDDEIIRRIYDISDAIQRASNAPELPEAYLYLFRLELALATNIKAEGKPEGEWMNHVESAKKNLDLGASGAHAATIDDHRRQIAALTEPPVAATPTQPVAPETKPNRKRQIDFLQQAKDLYLQSMDDNYDEATHRAKAKAAEAAINHALDLNPENIEAQKLRQTIKGRVDALFNQ